MIRSAAGKSRLHGLRCRRETSADGVTKYNQRSWTSATREDYRRVVDRILEGEVVRRVRDAPELPWEQRP
jgi:hypothetical protein